MMTELESFDIFKIQGAKVIFFLKIIGYRGTNMQMLVLVVSFSVIHCTISRNRRYVLFGL